MDLDAFKTATKAKYTTGNLSGSIKTDMETFLDGLCDDIDTFVSDTYGGGGSTKDYAEFYETTGGVTGVSSTAVTLNLSSNRENSDPTRITLSTNVITFVTGGIFKLDFDCYFNNPSSYRSEYSLWIEKDTGSGFSEIAGTRSAVYARGYDSGGSLSIHAILDVDDDDDIRFRVQRTDGAATNGYQDDNGTRVLLVEL